MTPIDFMDTWAKANRSHYGPASKWRRDFCTNKDMRVLRWKDASVWANGRITLNSPGREGSAEYKALGLEATIKTLVAKGCPDFRHPLTNQPLKKTWVLEDIGDRGIVLDHHRRRAYKFTTHAMEWSPREADPNNAEPWQLYVADSETTASVKRWVKQLESFMAPLIKLGVIKAEDVHSAVELGYVYAPQNAHHPLVKALRKLLALHDEGCDLKEWAVHRAAGLPFDPLLSLTLLNPQGLDLNYDAHRLMALAKDILIQTKKEPVQLPYLAF